jgi:hypothetical protein
MNTMIRSFVLAAVLGTAVPAMAEVVVVVNPSAPQASMTRDEVAQYFLGKSTALAPVDQPEARRSARSSTRRSPTRTCRK